MAQGRKAMDCRDGKKKKKWESSSDPSHLTSVGSGEECAGTLALNRQIFQML